MKLASLFPALLVLAMASSVAGAGPPAPSGAASPEPGDAAVLNDATLWREFDVPRCFYVRTAGGKLEPWDFVMNTQLNRDWLLLTLKPATSTAPGMVPPGEWTSPALDDAAWARVRLPQPVRMRERRPHMQGAFPAAVLVRGKFEVKDPARVKSCRLALEYWGGVVAYVNGKEAARGHIQSNRPLQEAVVEDYPPEAWTTPKGKLLSPRDPDSADRLALRDRKLETEISPRVLRQGLNLLAIEVHAAPIDSRAIKDDWAVNFDWQPIGLLSARLTLSSVEAAVPSGPRPPNIQVWNCVPYHTLTVFDYGDPADPLRPVVIHAARNGVFSGRLMVTSGQPIRGLNVSVTDLAASGGSKLPSTAVRVRCARPGESGKSWVPPRRFDGLFDAIPAVIPVAAGLSQEEIKYPERKFFHWRYDGNARLGAPGAAAPLWFTVRVPKDAAPGVYAGRVAVTAEGSPLVEVPLRVTVSAWTVPDPKDFRVHNFAHHSEETIALHYGVPRWSDKHFELTGKSLALMAETGSRQVFANLAVDYFGRRFMPSNAESLVRWIKQPDGSYQHDFTVFDKYLDMIAKYVGEPFPLVLNCWGTKDREGRNDSVTMVSLLAPATGEITPMRQPTFGTEESYQFWRPVFDEILKKLKARGWLKVTALGHNTVMGGVPEDIREVGRRLWPGGLWRLTSHDALAKDALFRSGVYYAGMPSARGYRELLQPRGKFTNFWGACFGEGGPLADSRQIIEEMIMSGHDGLGHFGWDLFPLKNAQGRHQFVACGFPRNPRDTMGLAVVYPGPDGPVATERYEMFRESVELSEALLFVERAIQEKRLSPELQQRAQRCLEDRGNTFIKNWLLVHGGPSLEEDAKLLDIAGEVDRELQ